MNMITDEEVAKMCDDLKRAFGRRLPEARLDDMVTRFLGWKLPEDFYPDCGISFEQEYNAEYMASIGKPPMRHEPVGTNLFTAEQTKKMLEYVIFGNTE